MAAISINDLSKTYPPGFPRLKRLLRMEVKPAVEALRNVSFEIGEGEIFGLIGRNGAGKTTLTKIIATLVQPTSGKVTVGGFDSIDDEIKVRSMIGLATAEERSFYWRLSCEKNMMFFARLYGMNDRNARRRISDIFEQIGLNEIADRRFSNISTGNKQKLAVARALLPSPPILLLDEPTRSLDPLAAAGMRDLIRSLEGVSILLTSHNLTEIEELCARVAVITKGEIKTVGTPQELRKQHAPVQTIKVTLSAIDEGALQETLKSLPIEPTIEASGEIIFLSFRRNPEDDLIGRVISAVTSRGATVLDIETEMPTLLDVLESYE